MKKSTQFRLLYLFQDMCTFGLYPLVALDPCQLEPDLPWWEMYKWIICPMLFYMLGQNSSDLRESASNWRRNERDDAMEAGRLAAEEARRKAS